MKLKNYFPFQVGLVQTKQALRLLPWLKSDCTGTSSNDYITDLCLISYSIQGKILMCVLAALLYSVDLFNYQYISVCKHLKLDLQNQYTIQEKPEI